MITTDILKKICPLTRREILDKYSGLLDKLMPEYGINSKLRIQHFIAQIAHESGYFQFVKEIGCGAKYEFRKDLGNIYKGDGDKYKGRGLIQITGRANYEKLSMDLFTNKQLVDNPAILEMPEYAIKSALWYWDKHKLNIYADNDDILTITRKINGGLNGVESRINLLNKCKEYI
jgi:putative chitinase